MIELSMFARMTTELWSIFLLSRGVSFHLTLHNRSFGLQQGGIEFFLLDVTSKNLQNIFRGENTSYWGKNIVGFDALWSKLLR